jgi:carotenoid 9,10(9',10')-cleavage dioxygenase 1
MPGGSIPGGSGGPLGNTAFVFHDSKLLALMEGGFPFLMKLCRGMVESIGAFTYGGKLSHSFTAHPKVDPDTGIMHTFCYKCAYPQCYVQVRSHFVL